MSGGEVSNALQSPSTNETRALQRARDLPSEFPVTALLPALLNSTTFVRCVGAGRRTPGLAGELHIGHSYMERWRFLR